MRIFILSVFTVCCVTVSFCQKSKYYIVFEENNKSGICDTLGNTLLQPEFDNLEIFIEKDLIVARKNGKSGVFDVNFKQTVPFDYDYISISLDDYSRNIFPYEANDKYGLLDCRKNKVIVPPIYDYIETIRSSNFFRFKQKNKYGVISQKGKVIIQPIFDDIGYRFSSNLLKVKKDNKYGFVNEKGEFIINPIFDFISDFKNDNAVFCSSKITPNGVFKECGIIDKKGDVRVQPIYDYDLINDLGKSIFIVKQGDKYGAINNKTELCLEPIYDWISNDLRQDAEAYVIRKGNKYGFIDQNGKIFIDLQYDGASVFAEGIAPVLKNEQWGVINLKGETVVDFKYVGWIEPFKNGVAKYHKCNSSRVGYVCSQDGYIDKEGNIFIEPIYDGIDYLYGNKAIAVFDGYTYLIDIKTKEKIKKLKRDDHIFMMGE
ncbi:MAG: WG repeat-containing protein [Bacteroidales bacterium]|jgi:hypothetical protein|nr:WG repeat-containing protein [Bacteroidales bacterium]